VVVLQLGHRNLCRHRSKQAAKDPTDHNWKFEMISESEIGGGRPGGIEAASTGREQLGFWEPVIPLPNVPVHTHLLPSGQILFWGRRVDLQAGMDQHLTDAYVLDPRTLEIQKPPRPTMPDGSLVNLFCSAHAFLSDGRLFVAGGHLIDGEGANQACLFDWGHNAWTPLPPMNHGRWYPSVNLMLDGSVLVTSGSYREGTEPQQNNHVPQVWSEGTGWRDLNGAVLSLYPRIHVLGHDRIFVAGTNPLSQFLDPTGAGTWSNAPRRANGDKQYAPSVTFAPGKILYIGGGNDPTTKVPSAACEVINFGQNAAAWRPTDAMSNPRRQHNATLLPDGMVLVTGGTKGGGFDDGFNDLRTGEPVHEAELWNPATEHWSTLAAENEDRCYHSTALLLPDGRVLSAGGGEYNPNGQPIERKDVHTSAQIFNPPYLFRGARPNIDEAPGQTDYGSEVFVKFSGAMPVRATILKPGSVTHSMDTNQRFVELKCRIAGQQAAVALPADPADCPPGFYMLFLLSADGVPSVAHFMRVGRSLSAAPATFDAAAAKERPAPHHAESLSARDERIEAEASGTRVVVGLTSRCPYGLAACWGGAYQTLKTMKGVDAVKAVANTEESTAEVFLIGNGLPDIDSWRATFREMAKGSYDFRGAEVTLTGTVQLQNGGLMFSGPGWLVHLDALGRTEKVQWDLSRRKPAEPTPAETVAYDRLLERVRVSGELPSVPITGPLLSETNGRRLHVRVVG
jgi:galactose oxidase